MALAVVIELWTYDQENVAIYKGTKGEVGNIGPPGSTGQPGSSGSSGKQELKGEKLGYMLSFRKSLN